MVTRCLERIGEGLMFYVNEQILSKVLSLESIPMDTELILLEFTVKNQRWVCVGTYRPPSQNENILLTISQKHQVNCLASMTKLC